MVIISMSSVLLATMPPLVVILPAATFGAGVDLPILSTSSGRWEMITLAIRSRKPKVSIPSFLQINQRLM